MKILITGASEGIGFEIAKNMAAKQNVITLVSRNKDKLGNALKNLEGKGHEFVVADLCRPGDLAAIKEKIEFENYDVLVNNAGVGMSGRFTELSLVEQTKMMNLNITALTELSYSFLQKAKNGAVLVNVSSTLGITSFPGMAVYSASKAYITSLSESLWSEYKNKGIYVFAFCPGVTYTDFHEVAGGSKDSYPKMIVQTPAQVAIELVKAIEKKKKPRVISGALNRNMVFFQKFMSRKQVINMMAGYGPIKK